MTDLAGSKPAYFSFSGSIDDAGVTRIAAALNAANNDGCDTIHLGISSLGGLVASGIYLYNHIRALPVQLVAYNIGSVASIAVTVFVGASVRYASSTSMFQMHPTAFPNLQGMTWERLKTSAEAALADDERIERILRDRTRIPDQLLQARRFSDVHLTPELAHTHGLVDGIAEFQVPKGFWVNQI